MKVVHCHTDTRCLHIYIALISLASINGFGSNCPLALRLVACNLLLEITAFLRETYQNLPKSSRLSSRERPPPWERMYSKEANRRWSMALSSMGHSQTSAQSLQSIAGDRDAVQAERKISFVLHEPDNESEGSSNTTVTMQVVHWCHKHVFCVVVVFVNVQL